MILNGFLLLVTYHTNLKSQLPIMYAAEWEYNHVVLHEKLFSKNQQRTAAPSVFLCLTNEPRQSCTSASIPRPQPSKPDIIISVCTGVNSAVKQKTNTFGSGAIATAHPSMALYKCRSRYSINWRSSAGRRHTPYTSASVNLVDTTSKTQNN